MVTLEVHDRRGKVEFVTIPPQGTALIGSDPKCEVQLDDPEALPVHARLRWKRNRLKIEPASGVPMLEINGQRLLRATLKNGDEIRIGSGRIFVMSAGAGTGAVEVEKTVVRTPPNTSPTRAGAASSAQPPTSRPRPAPLAPSRSPAAGEFAPIEPSLEADAGKAMSSRLDTAAWLDAMEIAPPSSSDVEVQRTSRRVRARGKTTKRLGPWRRLVDLVGGGNQPPDGEEEPVWTSPLVLGLAGTITVLALLGFLLWRTTARRAADARFQGAYEAFQDGDFSTAIRRFDGFLANDPRDPRTSRARVLRDLAEVRRLIAGAAPAWTEGLAAAETMARDRAREPGFADARADLATDTLRIGEGLAERSRAGADADALARAEAADALFRRLAGDAADSLRSRSRLPALLSAAREAVAKGNARRDTLAAMDRALGAGSAAVAFEARDRLVARFSDLARDPALVQRLTAATDLLRAAVKFDPSVRPAEIEPRSDPLGPITALVVRSESKITPTTGPTNVVFALVEGTAYGIEAETGAPLWAVSVGLSSPFAPISISGPEPAALMVDARTDELLRLDARTGRLRWRQALDGPAAGPPLVLGPVLVQATRDGHVLTIDADSGELRGRFTLGRSLAGSPVADERGARLHVLGDDACLFILTRDPPGCSAVAYLGHEPGSAGAGMLRVGRYLVIPVNDGINEGRWKVFLLNDDGDGARPIQEVPVPGWTWAIPASMGSVAWISADRGGLTALAIGAETDPEPFRLIARLEPGRDPLGPVFAQTRTERELIVAGRQAASYRLDLERGTVTTSWTSVETGPALAPIQSAGGLAVFTSAAPDGRGVSVRGLDPATGAVRWHSIPGAPWSVPPRGEEGGVDLVTLDPLGASIQIDPVSFRRGGFVESPLPGPGSTPLPDRPWAVVRQGDRLLIAPEPGTDHLLAIDPGPNQSRRIALPGALAARPSWRGDELVVALEDGLVALVDPDTGTMTAEPYLAPFDRDNSMSGWLTPAVAATGGQTVLMATRGGTVRRLVVEEKPRRRLLAVGEPLDLGASIVADPVAIGRVVILITDDGSVRALAANDLTPVGAWQAALPLQVGPIDLGPIVVLADAVGALSGFDGDGRRSWSVPMAGAPLVGPPVISGTIVWAIDREGNLIRVEAASGRRLDPIATGLVPAPGGLVAAGGSILMPVGRGAYRPLLMADEPTRVAPAPAEARP
jgi:outer membrane protein assembly factor BamB